MNEHNLAIVGIVFLILTATILVGTIVTATMTAINNIADRLRIRREKNRIKVYRFNYCYMQAIIPDDFCDKYDKFVFSKRNELEEFVKAKSRGEAIVLFLKGKPIDTLIVSFDEIG